MGVAAPRTPSDMRLYAIGDIHGRADLLSELHHLILADAEHAVDGRRVAIYLGDYVDRGARSADVIECLLGDPLPHFDSVFLKGNHEQLMLDYLDGDDGMTWFHNGGVATAQSYGVTASKADLWGGETTETRAALAYMIPEKHRRFFEQLTPQARFGDYLFVHAGIRPGTPLDQQSERDLLWIRDAFLSSQADHGVVVVHGHSITRTPDICPNRIGIDTGAWHSGALTALVLDGETRSFLQTGTTH